ncbi:hypothetical protein [Mesorhizobium sp. 131-2-1]|uniref:hypothetical protein n=1 Tax=Mesorhizobium sp. 131-2-1 TaxID=2744518 RepID=UPI001925AEDA|nr:hypothetical protein [Mesorhizobium sp. 131-2-1]BCG94452.1 hypothetical protein MesoLj131a_33160 [Mesorhizobium sp. 131-2-1]
MSTDWPFGRPDQFTEKIQSTDFKGAIAASGIAKQTPDQKAAIEAVMFALWAQGQSERWGESTALLVLFSRMAALVIDVLRLPAALIRHLPKILIGVAFVLAASYAVDWTLSRQAQAGLFLVAALVLFKDEILRWIRDVLFDIGDVFSNGALTRRYITRHFLYGPITVLEDTNGLKLHLASSRILTSGPYLKETEAFQETVARQIDDWPSLRTAIDGFWREFPKNQEYWRKLQRPTKLSNEPTKLSNEIGAKYLAEGNRPSVADVHTASLLPSIRITAWIIAGLMLLILSHAAETGKSILQSGQDAIQAVTEGLGGASITSDPIALPDFKTPADAIAWAQKNNPTPGADGKVHVTIGGQPRTLQTSAGVQ